MSLSIHQAIVTFALFTFVIGFAGSYMARVSDQLADKTGLGEAIIGTFLLAGATSLPDFAATLSAAMDNRPSLAMSNVMGSMAANLLFLAVADVIYRKSNLEHAAVSMENLTQAALLIALLSLPLMAGSYGFAADWSIHPVTLLIIAGYFYGVVLTRRAHQQPMWLPRKTTHTVEDLPGTSHTRIELPVLWLRFILLAGVTGGAGWMLMESAIILVDGYGLSESFAGGVMTALATSMPELVVTIAAIRQGALTLGLGNIVGTNCFNILVIAAADIGYHQASIYHNITSGEIMWGMTVILMTSILLLGLLQRQTKGIANIGFESTLMLTIYGIALVVTAG